MDSEKLNINLMLDLDKIQALLDSFSQSIGIASAIIDPEGEIIVSSNWQKICTDFHRKHPETYRRCIDSDVCLANMLLTERQYALYTCRNGLTDAAAPLIIQENHVANLFVGQFLLQPPDIDFFQAQAKRFGFDEDSYLEKLAQVPVISETRVRVILDFLSDFARLLCDMGLKSASEREAIIKLNENRALYRTLVENIHLGITLIDTNHKIVMTNRKHAAMHRKPAAYFTGKTCYREFEKRDHVCAHCPGKTAMDTGRPAEAISQGILDDGSTFDVRLMAFPVFDNGKPSGFIEVVENITDQKKLEARAKLLADVVERSRDFIGVADESQNALYLNRAGQEMVGLDGDEAVKRSKVTDCFFPDDLPFFTEKILPAVMEKGRWSGEFRFRHFKTGEPLQVLYDLFRTQDPDTGQTINFSSVTRNITALKQAEKELRKSKDQFHAIAENTSDSIIMTDEQGIILYWNKGSEQIFGYHQQEILGQSVDLLLRSHEKESRQNAFDENGRFKASESMNHVLQSCAVRKNGEEFPVEVTLSSWEREGRFYFCSIIRDITERIKNENSLKETKKFLHNVFTTTIDGLIVADARGCITMANKSAEEILGYGSGELIGKHYNDFNIHENSYSEEQQQIIKELFEKGSTRNFQDTWKKKNGEAVAVGVNMALMREDDDVAGVVCSIKDITEQLRTEERVRQTQKMEAIGTLAGGIAHDFNNILTGILGYSELALEDLAENLPVKDYLEDILQLGNRAKDLTQQILTFSRKSAREAGPILLQPVFKECLKMLRATIPSTIDLRQSIHPDCGPVIADPIQMHQLIMNLCTNAADEMRNTGGKLEVRMDETDIPEPILCLDGAIGPGKFVVLKVRDTGKGIPDENINRVFEPFFTTKEKGKGTGMGLAVVYGIARSHGGTVTLESVPGQGTTFTVLLPRADALAAQQEAADREGIASGNESILFVDDENAIIETAHRLFTRLGYKVTAVQSAAQALTLFRDAPEAYDIVITDQTMPKMTGFELARELLHLRPELPIILCTGFSETVSEETAKAAGIKAFVTKPFRRNSMAETIRRALDQNRE